MKLTIVAFLLLQSAVYAGPVCGNHSSTAESMACCEKGHNDAAGPAVGDSHAVACCATCDMGKGTAIKKQDQQSLSSAWVLAAILPDNQQLLTPVESVNTSWKNQKFTFCSPPDLVILNQSLLI